MVRSYMRHGPTQAFGVICSPTGNSAFDGRHAFVPAWEDVLVWDVKTGEQLSMWHSPGHTSPVSYISPAPSPSASSSSASTTYAVAYNNGAIKLWTYSSSNPAEEAIETVTFNGHKKGITTLSWDAEGTRLASGGTEGEIVIWDRIAEVGLFRLKGHRGQITSLKWIPHPRLPVTAHAGYLVSTSKDTYMKLWDLSTQHCVQTEVVGRTEVTSSGIVEEDDEHGDSEGEEIRGRWVVLTGSGDGECKAWTIHKEALEKGLKEDASGQLPKLLLPLCTLPLPASQHPITQITVHPSLPLIYAQTSDRTTIVLRLRSAEEVSAKRQRRKKRDKEKSKKKGEAASAVEAEDDEMNGEEQVKWEERVAVCCTVRANAKVRSFAIVEDAVAGKGDVPLLLALANNSLETYTIPSPLASKKPKTADGKTPEPVKTHSVELPGHKSDVRSISVSSDDQVIASASHGTLKIWNPRTGVCIRTMECGYAICSTFLPGDRHVVVGTKSGELLLFDIAASTLLATYKAHQGPVWSVHVRPDGRGLVSGSADKDVKFWDFEMKEDGVGERVVSRLGVETVHKTTQLALVHVRTLKMSDDVLAVKYSPDGRFLAVSLLDSTVKIFFQDTLKFFLSLYGHKLPVLSLDISHDSTLIVTCSADKNVKIWGMDFGDCHRSIFAHDDSVMQIAFEKGSHNFWTVGKDRMVKYWDGDKFELIQRLDGHHGEIWAFGVSNRGNFVVSGSHDKSIRVWEKTDEPLFLEEEREREIEAAYDANLADGLNGPSQNAEDGDEVEAVQKQSAETLMAGEKIMEAIELADADREAVRDWEEEKAKLSEEAAANLPPPQRSQELVARGDLDSADYMLKVVQGVPAANMEDALLVLPFRMVVSLLVYLDEWAQSDKDIILTSRILAFLLRTNHNQIVSNRIMRNQLLALRSHLREALSRQRQTLGYNLAALKFIKSRWEADQMAGMLERDGLDEDKVREKIAAGRSKRKRLEVV